MNSSPPCLHRRFSTVPAGRLRGVEVWQLADLYASEPWCALLDSARPGPALGRWTFVGGRPSAVLTAWREPGRGGPAQARIRIERPRPAHGGAAGPGPTSESIGDPFEAARALLREYWPGSPPPDAPPFSGGLVGAIGYEAGRCLEALPGRARDDLGLPDLALAAVDVVWAHDLQEDRVTLCVTGRGTTPQEAERDAVRLESQSLIEMDAYVARPAASAAPPSATAAPDSEPDRLAHWFDRAAYCAAVGRCRDHILAGDVFEVCPTRRIEAPAPASGWALYRALREENPAPFAAYLRFPGWQAISASPERFLRLDRERIVESRPIKGTRPRGATADQDEQLRRDLATSEKDLAENLMIVDLVRSDLGRVAEVGSVSVPQLRIVESYATVHQLVSTVRARLRPDLDAVDLLRACFPGGSMTGAPKIEAMKIIDSIEPVVRGVYSGAIGYLDAGGGLDLSIVIRTIVLAGGRASLGVGGAVTADSDPDAEYEETRDKARALLRALSRVLCAERD